MKRIFLQLHFLILFFFPVIGQESANDSLLKEIAFYTDVMVNADDSLHRIRAHDQFLLVMNDFLSTPNSYETSLEGIRWISVLHGRQFRIVTWQLRLDNENYKYGGFIQWPDKIVDLQDNRPWVNGSLRSVYTPSAWYGALYYEILPFKSGNEEYYLLFGFNAENSYLNTKVADILDLSNNGVKFGLPLFTGKGDPQTRIILTYADASSVHILYDPGLKAIVHDHLENLQGVGPSGEMLPVSDGSQEGWVLKNGKWEYQEEMYDVKSEVPPMTDERKDRKEDKDLFGRPKRP